MGLNDLIKKSADKVKDINKNETIAASRKLLQKSVDVVQTKKEELETAKKSNELFKEQYAQYKKDFSGEALEVFNSLSSDARLRKEMFLEGKHQEKREILDRTISNILEAAEATVEAEQKAIRERLDKVLSLSCDSDRYMELTVRTQLITSRRDFATFANFKLLKEGYFSAGVGSGVKVGNLVNGLMSKNAGAVGMAINHLASGTPQEKAAKEYCKAIQAQINKHADNVEFGIAYSRYIRSFSEVELLAYKMVILLGELNLETSMLEDVNRALFSLIYSGSACKKNMPLVAYQSVISSDFYELLMKFGEQISSPTSVAMFDAFANCHSVVEQYRQVTPLDKYIVEQLDILLAEEAKVA